MTNPSDIERVVMRRVRLIRILTFVISTVMLAAITAVVALWGIGKEVWVAHVFENMPAVTDKSQFFSFWLTAFAQTQVLVQVLVLLTAASLLFLLSEIARFIAGSLSRPARHS